MTRSTDQRPQFHSELRANLAAVKVVGRLEAVEVEHGARRIDGLSQKRQSTRDQRLNLIVDLERLAQIEVAKAQDAVESEMIGLENPEQPVELIAEELAQIRGSHPAGQCTWARIEIRTWPSTAGDIHGTRQEWVPVAVRERAEIRLLPFENEKHGLQAEPLLVVDPPADIEPPAVRHAHVDVLPAVDDLGTRLS